jgi:hypothetical protein
MLVSYGHIAIKDFVWYPPSCNKLSRPVGPSLEARNMNSAKNKKKTWGN